MAVSSVEFRVGFHPLRRATAFFLRHDRIAAAAKIAAPLATMATSGLLYDIGTMAPTTSGLGAAAALGLCAGVGIAKAFHSRLSIVSAHRQIEALTIEIGNTGDYKAQLAAATLTIGDLQRDLDAAKDSLRIYASDSPALRSVRTEFQDTESQKNKAVADIERVKAEIAALQKSDRPSDITKVHALADKLVALKAGITAFGSSLAHLECRLVEEGGIEIQNKLGEGGMGEVFKAYSLGALRPVVVKMLSRHGNAPEATLAGRLRNEATAMARLVHPFIARVYAFMKVQGVDAIVQEYVNGKDLSYWVTKRAAKRETAINLLLMIAEGLKAAHDREIIHRDIKPDNILVVEHEGQIVAVKLIDFGLAKDLGDVGKHLTVDKSSVSGTPAYMPPEQFEGMIKVGKPGDIYSLGKVAYELITGIPFASPSSNAMAELVKFYHLSKEPLPLMDPKNPNDPLQLLLAMMTAAHPESRVKVKELIEELRRIAKEDKIALNDTLSYVSP